jgi:hypothetical protein
MPDLPAGLRLVGAGSVSATADGNGDEGPIRLKQVIGTCLGRLSSSCGPDEQPFPVG